MALERAQDPDAPRRVDLPQRGLAGDAGPSAMLRFVVGSAVGTVVGVGVALPESWRYGVLAGWMAGALLLVLWTWATIGPMDAPATASHAVREDPRRAFTDLLVLIAALASLVAVGLFLAGGAATQGAKDVQAAMSFGSVLLAWSVVHTLFTTRYARLYYTGPDAGIDFNSDEPPRYTDFAYVAFTIGMTFQVSDTDLQTREIRATALRHGLISYLFGAVILATTINLVAGLAR
jgi:uncharacterized membrane protein